MPQQTKAATAIRSTVGYRLIDLRVAAGLSQRAAADESGMSQVALSNYERGRRDIPLVALLRLCDTYGTDPRTVIPDLPG